MLVRTLCFWHQNQFLVRGLSKFEISSRSFLVVNLKWTQLNNMSQKPITSFFKRVDPPKGHTKPRIKNVSPNIKMENPRTESPHKQPLPHKHVSKVDTPEVGQKREADLMSSDGSACSNSRNSSDSSDSDDFVERRSSFNVLANSGVKKRKVILDSSDEGESEKQEEKCSQTKDKVETSKTTSIFGELGVKSNSNMEDKHVTYDPTVGTYDPIKCATWGEKERVPYMALARTLEEIEKVSGRLAMIEILSNFFQSVITLTPNDFLPSLYLCLNRLGPVYEGLQLGIADATIVKIIAQSTGRTLSRVRDDFQKFGDLALVGEKSKTSLGMIYKPPPLFVGDLFLKLKEIAKMSGSTSLGRKIERIRTLFIACNHCESRFLIRTLLGKMRIGLAEQSILQAIALACTKMNAIEMNVSSKSDTFKAKYEELTLILKTTYCECPNYDKIIPVILSKGIEQLPLHCNLTPGVPTKPMLALPVKRVQEVADRFEGRKFTCEWKYDGQRAQIHFDANGIHIFSRHEENITGKYPDIISRIDRCRTDGVSSFILDCEVVAYDKEKNMILPFQKLSNRKRKVANEDEIDIAVCVYMFDLLYLNGEGLVKKPYFERRGLLREYFRETETEWKFATALDTDKMEELEEFLEESVKQNCEGLMVKTLDVEATYEISKRSRNWLKVKKDYLNGLGDTLDVVVIGGYIGKGKRSGNYGGFLLACYDADNEQYQSICKVGTGFSDENLSNFTEFLKSHKIPGPKSYYRYDASHEPDHWFDAVQVWEIKCADLSLSPVHRAALGIVDPEKGISLRFPRFIRIRDDKAPEQATSATEVAYLYSNQAQIKNQAGGGNMNTKEY